MAGIEESESEVVFLGLHEEVGGEWSGRDSAGEAFECAASEAGASPNEDVGVCGGFFGAVGESDVEDGGGEEGVVAEVADHLGDRAGVGVCVVVEEDDELSAGFSDGEVFGDGAAVFGETDEVDGGEGGGNEVGGVVGGGVVDDEDFKLGGGESVGEGAVETIEDDGASVEGGDAEADEGGMGHRGFIDRGGGVS